VRVFLLSLAAAIVAAITVNFAARPAAAATESSRSEASSSTLRLNRTLRRHYQLRQRWEISQRRRVVKLALHQVGIPYAWGGTSRSGFDCSGLVRWVYSNLGVSLPHYTVTQFHHGFSVRRRALKPGDLVFFNGLRHVGLYIGHGDVVHAPHTGTRVSVAPLSRVGGFAGARRLIPAY
jgi:cell wall-associated NlpC family hydrolase